MVLPDLQPDQDARHSAALQGVLRLPTGGHVVIFLGTVPIHEQPTTEGRIESAEDRAEQVAFDAWREA